MHPGGERGRRRRRARLVLIIVAASLVVLGGIGAAGVFGLKYINGLRNEASGGGFVDGPVGVPEGPVNAPVERIDLVSSVAATGSLASSKPITLGFPGPGKVTELTVEVGDTVTAGQVLARQDPRLAQLDVDAAKAALTAAERAAGLKGPATGEEKKAQDARVAEARVSVDSAATALERTKAVTDANAVALQSAVDTAQRALDRAAAAVAPADAAVAAAVAAEPSAAATKAASDELAAARAAAGSARTVVVQAADALAAATAGGNAAAIATAQARLDAVTIASDAAVARVSDAQSVIDAGNAARAATADARAAATAAADSAASANDALVAARDARRSGLAADAQTLDSSKSALAAAKAALQVLITGNAVESGNAAAGAASGTSPEELKVVVEQAKLTLEKAQAALDRLTIVAPIGATVTKVNAAVGDTLGDTSGDGGGTGGSGGGTGGGTGAADVITLTTVRQLVAEITIPETDAIKLEPGMGAEFKFSAIPDVIGTGKVLTVLPTDSDPNNPTFDPMTGLPSTQKTYTVTMSLTDPPPGARGGLTIAARVTIGSEQGVLAVPTAALSEFEGTTVVQRVAGDSTEEVEVTTGLRQGGYTQIVSGLDEGDEVQINGGGFAGDGGGAFVGDEPVVVEGG